MDPDRLARRIMAAGFVDPDDVGAERDEPAADPLARYEVLERIGSGGCGEVFRARDRHMDRVVALKRIPLPVGAQRRTDELRERLRREALALARLRHEGIPLIYDTSATDDALFVAMELVEGESMEAALDGRRLGLVEGVRAVEQAARIAHFAHTQGFVHRDLKPSNILLGRDGQVYVVDFGVVKAAETATLTATGMIVGTPAYTSPEQVEGRSREADARSDVFSLGAVLYHVLTGRPPFGGESLIALAVAIRERTPDPPSAVDPRAPLPLDPITCRALAKAPEGRYPTALALAEALAAWRRGKAQGTTVAPGAAAAATGARRTVALVAAAAGAAVVLALTLALAVASAGRDPPVATTSPPEGTTGPGSTASSGPPPAPAAPAPAPAPPTPTTEQTAPSQTPSPTPSTERPPPTTRATGKLVDRALAEWDRQVVLWPGVAPRLIAPLAATRQELAGATADPAAAWLAEAFALPGAADVAALQERLAGLRTDPARTADLWRVVGDLLLLDDAPDRAVEAHGHALALSTELVPALAGSAVALVRSSQRGGASRLEPARHAALRAMRLAPTSPHALFATHTVCLGPSVGLLRRLPPGALTGRLEDLRGHVALAERAASEAPGDPTCALVLAEACLAVAAAGVDAGLPFDAAAVTRAVRLARGVPEGAPGHVEALWVVAEASSMLARRGGGRSQVTQAEDALRGLLRVAPEHAPAHLLLGGFLSARGLVEEGERARARALALDPSLAPSPPPGPR